MIDRWLTDVAERVVRIIIVAVAATALAFGAGQVFGEFVSTLLIAPLLPALVALLGPRRWYLRVPLHGLALTVAMAGAVALEGDQIVAGTRDAVVDGVGQLVSTEWPSPRFATLVAVATGLLGVTTALAVEAARSRRWRVLPVLPLAACAGAIVAASAPAGAQLVTVAAVAFAAAFLLLTTHADTGLQQSTWTSLRAAPWRLAPPVALLTAGAIAVATVSMSGRNDPRAPEQAIEPLRVTDQLAEVVGQQTLQPPATIAVVEAVDGAFDESPNDAGDNALYFRTGVLTEYDGVYWTNPTLLRPIGGTLDRDAEGQPATDYAVVVGDLPLAALPTPGVPVAVTSPVRTDDGRTQLRIDPPLAPDTTVRVTARPFTTFTTAIRPATRQVDQFAGEFETTASRLAGDGTIAEKLLQLQQVLRNDFELEPQGNRGGGQQLFLIDRFLTTTTRGTSEQFVAGYVLLARSLGVDARIAIGYVTDSVSGDTIELQTDDARAWVEIRAEGGEWLILDPVPIDTATGEPEPDERPQAQAPSAAPLPAPPVPEVEERPAEPTPEEEESDIVVRRRGVIRTIAVGTVLFVATVTLVIVLIVAAKLWRLRRRLRRRSNTLLVRGAWASATDALVDYGLSLPTSATNGQIVDVGRGVVGGAATQLRQLAVLDDRARYSTGDASTRDTKLATDALHSVRRGIRDALPRGRRLRWWLSTRSLRRRSHSPVRD